MSEHQELIQQLLHRLWLFVFGGFGAILLGWVAWRALTSYRIGLIVKGAKPPPPPKHKLPPQTIAAKWADEAIFLREMNEIYKALQEALDKGDKETLMVYAQDRALEKLLAVADRQTAQGLSPRQIHVLSATVQSWEPTTRMVTVLFEIAVWSGGWMQKREEWVMEKRGGACFLSERHVL